MGGGFSELAVSGVLAFSGEWTLVRTITDRRAGAAGRFEGTCLFTASDAGLVCEERGRLRYGGQPEMDAKRRYLWRQPAPGRIVVDHGDGRPFHAFDLEPVAEAEHLCPPDTYRATYDFRTWPRWRVTWRVSGPRKDYVSVSDYRRRV